jgi:hypothetical protein
MSLRANCKFFSRAPNALAMARPCHRVVRTDGALSGYRWGVERKRALLDREAQSRVVVRKAIHANEAVNCTGYLRRRQGLKTLPSQ